MILSTLVTSQLHLKCVQDFMDTLDNRFQSSLTAFYLCNFLDVLWIHYMCYIHFKVWEKYEPHYCQICLSLKYLLVIPQKQN